MKRKLIRQGLGGVTISLPIKWVRKKRLKPGDEINLEERDGSLLIGGAGKGGKNITLKIDPKSKNLTRTIIATHYRLGYFQLTLEFTEEQPFEQVQEIVNSLIGYEIVHQDKDTCVIQDVMGSASEDAEKIINKLFQSIYLLAETAMVHLEEGGQSRGLKTLRSNMMKLRDYAQRHIAIEGAENAYELYSFVLSLEKVGGDFYHITTVDSTTGNKAIGHLQELLELLRHVHKEFLTKEFSKANRAYTKLWTLVKKDFQESTYFSDGVTPEAHFCDRILHNIFTMCSRLQGISK